MCSYRNVHREVSVHINVDTNGTYWYLLSIVNLSCRWVSHCNGRSICHCSIARPIAFDEFKCQCRVAICCHDTRTPANSHGVGHCNLRVTVLRDASVGESLSKNSNVWDGKFPSQAISFPMRSAHTSVWRWPKRVLLTISLSLQHDWRYFQTLVLRLSVKWFSEPQSFGSSNINMIINNYINCA